MRVKKRERERERGDTSDSAKVCGLTRVCSVAKGTAARRSEQLTTHSLSHSTKSHLLQIISIFKPKPKKSLLRLIALGQFVFKTITECLQ